MTHVSQTLAAAIAARRRHLYLDEEFLFPGLSASGLVAPIFVMLREHAQIWQTLDALEGDVAGSIGTQEVSHLCRQLPSAVGSCPCHCSITT